MPQSDLGAADTWALAKRSSWSPCLMLQHQNSNSESHNQVSTF
jgi:hypothetical protein